MNLSEILTEKELKIRTWWLRLILLSVLVGAVNLITTFFQTESLAQNGRLLLSSTLSFIVSAFLFNYGIYYCAYLRAGTKYLLFAIVLMALAIPGLLFLYFNPETPAHLKQELGVFPIAYTMLYGSAFIVLSYKMRKINLKIKRRGPASPAPSCGGTHP